MAWKDKERVAEIDAELMQLRQRREELLAEKSQLHLSGAVPTTKFWAHLVFVIINSNPGATRNEIRDKLTRDIPENDLTNVLTALRRRGWIHNFGTRKRPSWHVRLETPEILVFPEVTPEGLYLQDQRRREWDAGERRVQNVVRAYH